MDVSEIIAAVRLCFDEESSNSADFADASSGDSTLMDNIIRSKIGDAVRWVCIYAPSELLGGKDGTTSVGILVDKAEVPMAITYGGASNGGYLNMPDNFIRLVRVRCMTWHKAVMNPIAEDSDEYLQLSDKHGAEATADRPQAALIERASKVIEVYPGYTNGAGIMTSYTYVCDPTIGQTYSDSNAPLIPPKAKTAFIYYLAFLVLSAYDDPRSTRMLDIAKMNIGRTDR